MKKINLAIDSNESIEHTIESVSKTCRILSTMDNLFLDIDLICRNNNQNQINRLVQWFGEYIGEFKKTSNFVIAAGLYSPAQFYNSSNLKKIGHTFNRLIVIPDSNTENTYSALKNISKLSFAHCYLEADAGPAEAYRQYSSLSCDIICRNEYSDDICSLFDEWKNDIHGADISVFSDIIKKSLYNFTSFDCVHNSCLGKYIYVSPDGVVSFCRKHPAQSIIDSLDNIGSFSQLMSGDNFRSVLINALEKRKRCREMCADFKKCSGGCPLNSDECCEKHYISVYNHAMSEFIRMIDECDYGAVNPALRQAFITAISSGKKI